MKALLLTAFLLLSGGAALAQGINNPGPCTAFGTTAGTCLQGNGNATTATTATNATNINVNSSATSATFYPVFVATGTGNQASLTSSKIVFNPSAGNFEAEDVIGTNSITNRALTSGRLVLSSTGGIQTDSSLFTYSTTNQNLVLVGAGSDTIVGGPGFSWNSGSGIVQHWQLGASNQLCLWGNPSTWRTNFCVATGGTFTMNTAIYASCTALTTNGSGVIGCTASDPRLKNIDRKPYSYGLETITNIVKDRGVISFRGKPNNPENVDTRHRAGFNCLVIEKHLPLGSHRNNRGYCNLDPEGIQAALFNAVVELKISNDALRTRVKNLENK